MPRQGNCTHCRIAAHISVHAAGIAYSINSATVTSCCLMKRHWLRACLYVLLMIQEAEYAEMLKSRIESGKSASTSSPSEAGVEEDSIFADIDTDGIADHSVHAQQQQ